MMYATDRLAKSLHDLESVAKAFGAKDYSKLIKKEIVNVAGKKQTIWVSPEDERQNNLFSEEDAGKGNEVGKRGYLDHVDQTMNDAVIKPLIDKIKDIDPELAPKFEHKYASYPFDRDTKELDVKIDLDTLWYMKKMKENPDDREEYQDEYNEKVTKLVKQVNNRKKAMLKVKPGDTVKYHGRDAIVAEFSKRGFPVLDVGGKKENAFWEEIAS
jgi:hypothetical protein